MGVHDPSAGHRLEGSGVVVAVTLIAGLLVLSLGKLDASDLRVYR
jgi:hypothetical protein